ncbi:LuxR C-terminal-related transcriptional regulator [Kitasatospora sp. NPDC057223]|uniref:helix-turn-helix transcriptional regulator n=1 Tax=Kitasatospora sp. NPDC057223 TaxID=3346055 RepID=UPI00362FE4FE
MRDVDSSSALGLLKEVLAASTEGGGGQLALIQGSLACGKTSVLCDFAQWVAASGALILTATGSRTESDLPAGLIDQLFQSPGLPAELTERIRRMITSAMLAEPDGPAGSRTIQQPGALLVHEASRALLELARTRPLVILVDDVHFADSVSLRLLLHLLRRMGSVQVVMVLTEWDWPQPPLPPLRAELAGRPHHLIRLGPLTGGATTEMITRSLGPHVSAELATSWHDLTGGNPLLVKALIEDERGAALAPRASRAERGDTWSPTMGFAFAEAVAACLHRWEPLVLQVAQGIAVLGNRGEPESIGRLMEVRPEAAERVMHTLCRAGLLLGGRFRHPTAETAVLDTLSPEERSAVHGRAAELLYQRGVAAVEVARQIIAADRTAESWMLPVLRTAAEQAVVEDDVPLAIQCLETALRAADDSATVLAVTAALARTAWRLNPSVAAPYLPPLQSAVQEGVLHGRDTLAVVRCALWNGDTEGVTAVLRALSDSSALEDGQLYAEVRLAHQWHYGSDRDRFQTLGSVSAAGGEPWGQAANELAAVWNQRASGAATGSAEQVLQNCHLEDSTLELLASAVQVLMAGGKLTEALDWCDQLIEEAQRRRAVTWQMLLGSLRARVSLRQGRITVAAGRAEEVLGLLSGQSWGVLIGCPLSTLVTAYTAMGRYDAAAEALQQGVPEAMFDTVHGLRYLHARGHYYLATDRVLAAISDFQRCGRLMQDWDLDVASLVPWRSSLAEANLRLGRTRVAYDLVKRQMEQARTMDERTKGISLRVLGASSDFSRRSALLAHAVSCLESAGDRLELARALEDLGQVYQELDELTRARMLARRAAQETKACNSGAVPARLVPPDLRVSAALPARRVRRAEPAEPAEPPMLSDAQRRVAELAALGHTNQEISRRLYITVSTVEQHLTRVFRKLGVNSRNDLPAGFSDLS